MNVLVIGGCGYVGSALVPHLRAIGHAVSTIDLEWFGGAAGNIALDYGGEWLQGGEDAVILLAGHSSVGMCRGRSADAYRNNVLNFERLVEQIPARVPVLYASSISVYEGCLQRHVHDEACDTFRFREAYDFTKGVLDHAAAALQDSRFGPLVGLRFGTVCGWSPRWRTDLMVNQMVLAAHETGIVRMANPAARRPILGMADLRRGISAALAKPAPGLFNLASFCASVSEVADAVAEVTGAAVELSPPSETYDIDVDTARMRAVYGWNPEEDARSIASAIWERLRRDGVPPGARDRRQPREYAWGGNR